MPVVLHVYGKKPAPKTQARHLRSLPETKFSLEWEACLPQEKNLEHAQLQLLKRHLSKDQLKELKKRSSGFTVTFKDLKNIGDHHYRLLEGKEE